MIGGSQGSGVDSAANMYSIACNRAGLWVYGQREYYSNIMGEHSYFVVRVNEVPIRSHFDEVNLLATFDSETVVRHFRSVSRDGGIIYNPEIVNVKLNEISTLDARLLHDTQTYLKDKDLGNTVQDTLEDARRRGVRLYPIPYTELLKKVGKQFAETQLSRLSKMVNTMAVSASFGLLGFNEEKLKEAINAVFVKKPKVAKINSAVADYAYVFTRDEYGDGFGHSLESVDTSDKRAYLQGNQAVALGKLLGGCRFQTYYPISPATDESVYLEDHELLDANTTRFIENPQVEELAQMENREVKGSIIVVQAEDEIAAITMATGAAITGVRAATSTSGPGFSLMVEGLGWAGINEVPVVVTLYQRGGPSTGMPTRHEQGDLKFALYAGHGEFPRMILASGDVAECFYDGVNAFNYAEMYQLPVIHLVDKYLASTTTTCPIYDIKNVKINRGKIADEEDLKADTLGAEKYRRFKFTDTGISPKSTPGMRGGTFWLTGDEHDELGHITEDPVIRTRMMEKRMGKLSVAANEIPIEDKVNFIGPPNAEATIVSWGSTKGVILDVIDRLKEDGRTINFLQIRLLEPFPTEYVSKILSKSPRRIDVEMNYGAQLAGLIRERTGLEMDHTILKYNGRPITMDELYGSVKKVILERKPRKMVMTHGT